MLCCFVEAKIEQYTYIVVDALFVILVSLDIHLLLWFKLCTLSKHKENLHASTILIVHQFFLESAWSTGK